MPRYTNARQTPIVLSNGRVIATGESFDEEDLVAQSAVRIGLALDNQAPRDAGVESHERVEGVGVVQHEPTPEQAAAQKAHDDRQKKTTNTRRSTRRKGES